MNGSTAAGVADRSQEAALRAQRLRTSGDVRAVFAARRAAGSPLAVVHARPRADAGAPRVTVVAGKRVGNAVARNRVKRRLRAGLQQLPLAAGVDYVVVGRPAALTAGFSDLIARLGDQVQRVTVPR